MKNGEIKENLAFDEEGDAFYEGGHNEPKGDCAEERLEQKEAVEEA